MRPEFATCIRFRACALVALLSLGLPLPMPAQAYEDGWRDCAEEGQTCRVSGRAVVRYGAEGQWTTRTVFDGIACNNEAFGDPAPQMRKRCQVRASGHGSAGGHGPSAGWSFCAAEGEICRFQGRSEVRFGQGDRFITRSAYGSVRCDVRDFGDPAVGVTKFCEVRSSAAMNGGNSTRPDWNGWGQQGDWRYCAAEGGSCRVDGRAQVRFGDGQRFSTRSVEGDVSCNVDTFGDPAVGVLKHCEMKAGRGLAGGEGWSPCAREGKFCSFSGHAQVRYGTLGRYLYRDGRNGVTCNSDAFGGDPYPGRVKSCEVRR